VALNVRAEVVAERWVPMPADQLDAETALARLAALILEVTGPLSEAGAELVGVTVAVPGLVERSTGRVPSPRSAGWRSADIRVGRHTRYLYVLLGLCCGVAALMLVARTTTGRAPEALAFVRRLAFDAPEAAFDAAFSNKG
jgi:hypothetical protein